MKKICMFILFIIAFMFFPMNTFAAPSCNQPHNSVNYNHGHKPPPKRHYVRRYYTTPYYAPVVVYSGNQSYVAEHDDSTVVAKDEINDKEKKFGFGINALLSANSSIGDIKNKVSGGLGLYAKLRPVKFFSFELQNGYTFGSLQYDTWDSQSYVKASFILGARLHFLNYSNTDVYAAFAWSGSVWSYLSRYDYRYDSSTYMYKRGGQYGGQLGAGVSYITGALEVGMDIRYTIETVPNSIPDYIDYKRYTNVVHGMLLKLNFGFAL